LAFGQVGETINAKQGSPHLQTSITVSTAH
jgi:hypothetical protein